MPLTPAERSLRGLLAAEVSWANTENRSARTANARKALEKKFLAQADGDPQRAAHLRRAHYARMALASAKARRARACRTNPAETGHRQAVVAERIAELDGGEVSA